MRLMLAVQDSVLGVLGVDHHDMLAKRQQANGGDLKLGNSETVQETYRCLCFKCGCIIRKGHKKEIASVMVEKQQLPEHWQVWKPTPLLPCCVTDASPLRR